MANRLEHWLKIIGAIATVGGLLLALVQFSVNQSVQAQKPFLEKKLAWCEEASRTAAAISVRGPTASQDEVQRFWELYWGVMGLVENEEVTGAMVRFGDALQAGDRASLPGRSLAIAHACRAELARDWSPIWRR